MVWVYIVMRVCLLGVLRIVQQLLFLTDCWYLFVSDTSLPWSISCTPRLTWASQVGSPSWYCHTLFAGRVTRCLYNSMGRGQWEAHEWSILDSAIWAFYPSDCHLCPSAIINHNHESNSFSEFLNLRVVLGASDNRSILPTLPYPKLS